jgi:hypothetical protein
MMRCRANKENPMEAKTARESKLRSHVLALLLAVALPGCGQAQETQAPESADSGSVEVAQAESTAQPRSAPAREGQPNIVIVFMDNFGWGEPGFNGGGITRGAATPRLDKLASEGLRLTNFNVEVQCTPLRSAIMTGRYAIRSGNGTVPLGEGVYGLVQWEVTMAEMLTEAGYATGM